MFYNGQLQLPNNQPMTATEIEKRYELMNRVLGPTLGPAGVRAYQPHRDADVRVDGARRARSRRRRRKCWKPPRAGDDHLDVLSEGPLARAQKGSDVLAWERTFEVALPIAQVDPSAIDPPEAR